MSAGATIVVDLWIWPLDVEDAERARLKANLSGDEVARADRFAFERDRNRFIVGRGRMREILARELGRAPAELVFAYSTHDKPSLVQSPLRFNLSHSQALAALAASREREVGIDIEAVRPIEDNIAEQYFSPREVAALRALPKAEQLAAFYRCWTRKEAIVKAIGEGLSHPLNSFDVSLGPAMPAVVERFEGEADAAGVWRLANFEPASGYAGAVACRTAGGALSLRVRSLED